MISGSFAAALLLCAMLALVDLDDSQSNPDARPQY